MSQGHLPVRCPIQELSHERERVMGSRNAAHTSPGSKPKGHTQGANQARGGPAIPGEGSGGVEPRMNQGAREEARGKSVRVWHDQSLRGRLQGKRLRGRVDARRVPAGSAGVLEGRRVLKGFAKMFPVSDRSKTIITCGIGHVTWSMLVACGGNAQDIIARSIT